MKKHPEIREQTKRHIIDAFWSLTIEKGLTKVNVSDIAKVAEINRGTFYEYFLDINDLIKFVETEILENYISKMLLIKEECNPLEMRPAVYKVIEYLTGNDDKLLILLSSKGDPNFVYYIKEEMSKAYTQLVDSEKLQQYSEYIIVFMSSALIGLITHWYETGKRISIDELTEILLMFATKGMITNLIEI